MGNDERENLHHTCQMMNNAPNSFLRRTKFEAALIGGRMVAVISKPALTNVQLHVTMASAFALMNIFVNAFIHVGKAKIRCFRRHNCYPT
nr:hypothetical protein [Tanacetum cinerariifolium]